MKPEHFSRRAFAVVAAGSLVVAACGGSDEAEPAESASPAESDGPTETDAPVTGEFDGATVDILGAFVDADADTFDASVAAFEDETGIDVVYTGSGDFTTLITTQVEAGSPPDVAFFPTPGQIADFASRGEIQPLSTDIAATASENYIDSWIDLGSYEGDLYGLAYKASVKSMVWYSPSDFADAGYEPPATMDGLSTLVDQMVADGNTPWCVGFESGEASGWPGTDWIEDIMLRQQSPEFYDQWVANEVSFDDAGVAQAFQTFSDLVLTDGHTFGGGDGIVTTAFGDAQAPMFAADGPECWMHHQASFFSSFLPEGTTIGPDGDVNVFITPSGDDGPAPILGGGDFAVAFTDRPEVQAFMNFMATPAAGETWAAQGGYVAPYSGFDTSLYPEGIDKVAGEALASAEVFRFDGSDAMPGPVQPAFWGAMVELATGSSIDDVLADVQAAFDDQ